MEIFADDVKLRGFPSEVPFPPILPWKKSKLAFSKARNKAPSQNYYFIVKSSPASGELSLCSQLQAIARRVCTAMGHATAYGHAAMVKQQASAQ